MQEDNCQPLSASSAVQVPASYLDREVGLLPTPRAQPVSPGATLLPWQIQWGSNTTALHPISGSNPVCCTV